MSKYIKVLGIESSCDDTGVAIIDSNHSILSNIIISQKNEHEAFQGVVPEIAARSHMKNLKKSLEMALHEANTSLKELDIISATCGPGLIGGVIVGSMFAKSISSVLKKPFIAINHLEGHALTAKLTNKLEYPYLLLLASGGHCQYVAVLKLGRYKILGETLDDAIGETFDKVAKMMDIGFPGGAEIEKKAKLGNKNRFILPMPMVNRKNCDMSFSGLKTAVKLTIERIGVLSEQDICDVASSFQNTVMNILYKKTKDAINAYEKIAIGKTLVVAGGVAANEALRSTLFSVAKEYCYNFIAPPTKLCTDNAAMIAFAGLQRFNAGIVNNLDFKPLARWSLEDL